MTDACRESLVSKHDLVVYEDNLKYDKAVAGVWNAFLDIWRGKEYDYVLIVANDTIATPNGIDFMIKCAEENPESGLITGMVTRDLNEFKKKKGEWKYTSELTKGLLDPACFLLRKGVIEKVGRIDEVFKKEFVERDFLYRCQLADYNVIQPDVITWYHPPYAGTIGNSTARLHRALRKYVQKWNGDANCEQWKYPYNDLSLTYKFTGEYKG